MSLTGASTRRPEAPDRVVFYLLSGPLTSAARHAVDALASASRRIVLIGVASDLADVDIETWIPEAIFCPVPVRAHTGYRAAVDAIRPSLRGDDELVFTGDVWFGPVGNLEAVLNGMSGRDLDHWIMMDSVELPVFPDEGFPAPQESWVWTVLRARVLDSPLWARFWSGRDHSEAVLTRAVRDAERTSETAFPSATLGAAAAVFAPDLLLEAGCPLMRRTAFGLYPPYLHQQAFLGRDVLTHLNDAGYPIGLALDALTRAIAPKALNTSAGMLEIVPPGAQTPPSRPPRIVVVAHVGDLDRAAYLFDTLRSLPPGWHLVVTTGDGRKAARLAEVFRVDEAGPGAVEIRVTPGGRGRDMGDFFVACRDVIHSDDYDLIVKVHARSMRRKTTNVRRYFRRYQLENLLGSDDHVRAILRLFEFEPQLGLVFPPMMHIGVATMGRAWAGLRGRAVELCERIGVHVPLDVHSPLAPFGGMWIARPAALRRLAIEWQYRDYGEAGRQRYRSLAHLQERLIAPSAAQDGYHSRTVLTAEHAAISHTALEFKADQLMSTTTGYPVDQIRFMHRAGRTGHGGIVGLSRMYLSLNHRLTAAVVLPALAVAERVYGTLRHLTRRSRFERADSREEEL